MKKYFICVLAVATLMVPFVCSDADEDDRPVRKKNHNRYWDEKKPEVYQIDPSDLDEERSPDKGKQSDAFDKRTNIEEAELRGTGNEKSTNALKVNNKMSELESSSGEEDESGEDTRSHGSNLDESRVAGAPSQVPDSLEAAINKVAPPKNTTNKSNQDKDEGPIVRMKYEEQDEVEEGKRNPAELLLSPTNSFKNERKEDNEAEEEKRNPAELLFRPRSSDKNERKDSKEIEEEKRNPAELLLRPMNSDINDRKEGKEVEEEKHNPAELLLYPTNSDKNERNEGKEVEEDKRNPAELLLSPMNSVKNEQESESEEVEEDKRNPTEVFLSSLKSVKNERKEEEENGTREKSKKTTEFDDDFWWAKPAGKQEKMEGIEGTKSSSSRRRNDGKTERKEEERNGIREKSKKNTELRDDYFWAEPARKQEKTEDIEGTKSSSSSRGNDGKNERKEEERNGIREKSKKNTELSDDYFWAEPARKQEKTEDIEGTKSSSSSSRGNDGKNERKEEEGNGIREKSKKTTDFLDDYWWSKPTGKQEKVEDIEGRGNDGTNGKVIQVNPKMWDKNIKKKNVNANKDATKKGTAKDDSKRSKDKKKGKKGGVQKNDKKKANTNKKRGGQKNNKKQKGGQLYSMNRAAPKARVAYQPSEQEENDEEPPIRTGGTQIESTNGQDGDGDKKSPKSDPRRARDRDKVGKKARNMYEETDDELEREGYVGDKKIRGAKREYGKEKSLSTRALNRVRHIALGEKDEEGDYWKRKRSRKEIEDDDDDDDDEDPKRRKERNLFNLKNPLSDLSFKI